MTLLKKIMLEDAEMPKQWYNLAPDLPTPMNPPLGPDGKPITPEMLAPVFPMNLIEQEVSQERWIDIPEPIREMLAAYRPIPLVRAYGLEKALGTPAKIFYKNESLSPVGSHKGNTAIAQAWYNKQFGIKRLTTETGAGQWGSALSYASALLGLECKVFMVRVSFNQKPYRKMMMNTWGATCVASPSTETQAGRNILAEFPDTPGSLGIAISEAIEQAVMDPKGETRYSLGSVLNHVMLHQTIIGLETKKQLAKVGIKKPDVVVGCCGGGSNFAGLSFPFIYDKIHGSDIKIVGIEPFSCPTLTKAPFVYDHGDVARMTPLLPMYSLGHSFIPAPIHAGGLRYHGMAPLVSAALRDGLMEAQAVHQSECFEAGLLFAKTEGTIPAPETTHAIAGAIREAKLAKEEGKEKIIVFNFTGHGLLDLAGYEKYMTGQLTDYEYPEAEITKNLEAIKGYPLPK
ncbi:MAG: TrpB-like pyridoxal phosphate-dependent enzyme [Prolixibacteraceae bacterium]|jgi:tryptophan synthase beta chain|nr:TrpB-like pyridoxal phosphate-dependent enzyme [Prolixibacteraceae bacterium]NLX29628.1 TrpB-like pyridoxal phosphate-dependent enzyme [Bacteroidales bacterium]HNQ37933.1 TrpB-like pyridoxal phosphate-dependent enzyme [Prolixibacteraceae bacterium]HPJ78034.1 TrpB-like pyridoxal phosphate-dependent enzyme [Prolixibacteraceae bacterium]